ncbi:MAG: hypothetical protein U0169_16070 [Polyangiaceae bacterium]
MLPRRSSPSRSDAPFLRDGTVRLPAFAFAIALAATACTSGSVERRSLDDEGTSDAAGTTPTGLDESDAGSADASVAPDAPPDVMSEPDVDPKDKAARCASEFGTALTAPYGRLDGTVLAVLKPTDQQCPRPNGDHVIVQVTMNGAPYRMVVNVLSTVAGVSPDVRILETPHTLVGPPWSEGWHTDASLDYVSDLGVGLASFTPYPMATLSDRIADRIVLGDHVSVYASTSGGDSAHLVHRNKTGRDGALVLHADGPNPEFVLFAFANQSF